MVGDTVPLVDHVVSATITCQLVVVVFVVVVVVVVIVVFIVKFASMYQHRPKLPRQAQL